MNAPPLARNSLAFLLAIAPSLYPQTSQPAAKAHQHDFDYLLGDWAFTSQSRQYGKFAGYWSSVRLATGQILDEYRVADSRGETLYATTTVRAYNEAADCWELIGMDPGGGLRDFGVARRVGSEMHIDQTFGAAGAHPWTMRIRYYNIQPGRFSWAADRSTDGGKTWVRNFQTIESRRIGPPRSLGPLAPPRKTEGKP